MHLQKLEFIVEVAKTGSISSAAKNLHVSQAGISQAIANIEEDLGLKISTVHV
ncbi:LysR family transcriptional regulator [Gottfriedia sp. NPDC057991]|uniref:LysR family transcriptional regulator n=1 Tax=Gottfriedia sp. NPDC057991 TaxID=3346298 RepID=UPI0036DDAFD0